MAGYQTPAMKGPRKWCGVEPSIVMLPNIHTRQVSSGELAIAEPEPIDEPSFDFGNLLEMLRGLQDLAE